MAAVRLSPRADRPRPLTGVADARSSGCLRSGPATPQQNQRLARLDGKVYICKNLPAADLIRHVAELDQWHDPHYSTLQAAAVASRACFDASKCYLGSERALAKRG